MITWKVRKKEIKGFPRSKKVILETRERWMDIVTRMEKIDIKEAREFILHDTEINFNEVFWGKH